MLRTLHFQTPNAPTSLRRRMPSEPGAHIEVKVDPFDTIEELTNSNNRRVAQYDSSGGAPTVSGVVARWDGDGNSSRFGRYVEGIDLENTFEAVVVDPDGVANVDYVTFTLGSLGTKTDYSLSNGWTATFNMGDLSGDSALTVIAYDNEGNVSDSWQGTVHVVDFPSWIGTPGADDYFDRGRYYLNGLFPEFMEQSFAMPTEMYGVPIPIIGGTESGFRTGIESTVVAPLSTRSDPYGYLEFVAYAEVFDQTLLDVRYAPEYRSDYFSLSISDYDINRDSLRLDGFYVTAELTDLPLGSFNTPEYPILGVGVPVLADISLRASAGIAATLSAGITLHLDGSGVGVSEAWLAPEITGLGSLVGAGRALGFDLARAQGSLELVLNPRLDYSGGSWHAGLSGSMRIPWEVSVGAGWLSYTWDGVIPDEAGWVFGWGDVDRSVIAAPLLGATADAEELASGIRPMLAADQDAAGNSMLLRVVDDGAETGPNGNIYYAYRPSGGSWTALQPLATSGMSLSSPVVAMDGQGGALAVWVANDLANDGSVTPTASELFSHQDLYASYFDGNSWSTPTRITDDSFADGQPSLACDPATGNATLVWTRSEMADAMDRAGFEIASAAWDHGALSWSPANLITSDSTGDWSPHVAYNDASQAMVVWTRDGDGNLASRQQAYSLNTGGTWSVPYSGFVAGGAAETAIAAAPGGSFVVACVREAATHEQLMTAVFDPSVGAWYPTELIAEGQIIQEPRLALNRSGVATLVWQTTDPQGRSDLAAATRDFAGGGAWATAGDLTDSAEIEWMPVLMFDDAGDAEFVYEVSDALAGNVLSSLTGSLPGLGDGIATGEAGLVADLSIVRLYLTNTSVVEGEPARLAVDVHNVGWGNSEGTLVSFYQGDPGDGGVLIGDPVPLDELVAGASATCVMSDAFTLPSGTNEYYAVIASVAGEVVTANNALMIEHESLPPDITGPTAGLELHPGDSLPVGTETLVLTFSEPIDGLDESDVSCVESRLGTIAPDHVLVDTAAGYAELIFEGGLPAGSYTLKVLDKVADASGNPLDGDGDGAVGGDYVQAFSVDPAEIAGRYVFYNHSAWDGDDAGANAGDDAAIASDKQPLLPGAAASEANATERAAGINGIMVDVMNLAASPGLTLATIGDYLELKVGNDGDPGNWADAPMPIEVAIRPGEGANGSDRVTIIFEGGAILRQWLQVTVKAGAATGLEADDVFYFGNDAPLGGDCTGDSTVGLDDFSQFKASFGQSDVGFAGGDFNGDGTVGLDDFTLLKANFGQTVTPLEMITAPAASTQGIAAMVVEPVAMEEVLVVSLDASVSETALVAATDSLPVSTTSHQVTTRIPVVQAAVRAATSDVEPASVEPVVQTISSMATVLTEVAAVFPAPQLTVIDPAKLTLR